MWSRRLTPAIALSVVLLAGCGGMQVTPSGRSWMLPSTSTAEALLYVGDWQNDDVHVYDFKSGDEVGNLGGFSGPYGMCVDAQGDVLITNFGFGNAVEYARGGTQPVNSYVIGGEPIGCSVDAKGNVAMTSTYPGEVIVFARGDPSKPTFYSDRDCEQMGTAGYDNKGNLYAAGSGGICEVPAGATKMHSVTLTGASIRVPGGTMWDGQHLVLTDQAVSNTYQTGLIRVSEDAKTGNLTALSESMLGDSCYRNYADVVNPFVVGAKNTPVNHHQGRTVVGPDLFCNEGTGNLDVWKYFSGGSPTRRISISESNLKSAAVSLAP